MLLALDISTSVIGLAIFDGNYKLHELTYLKFNAKEKSLFRKLDIFIEFLEKYNLNFEEIVIEEPLLRFKGKFSNAQTIQKLTQMNSLISGFLYRKHKVEPIYYNVQTARKLTFPNLAIPQSHPNKKNLVWEAVMQAEPTINWKYTKMGKLVEGTYDSTDAYVVGMAHVVSKIKQKTLKAV